MTNELTETAFTGAVLLELKNRDGPAVATMVQDHANSMSSMGPCDVAHHEGLPLTDDSVSTVVQINIDYFEDLPESRQAFWEEQTE